MNNFLKLKDGTMIEIEEDATLEKIVSIAPDETKAIEICKKITDDNVCMVEFQRSGKDKPYGTYENVTLSDIPSRQTKSDGTVIVTIRLRKMTEIETVVHDFKQSQEMQNAVLDQILMGAE